jgi:hypothetical protein
MSSFLLDSNVLLDLATADPSWQAWSEGQLRNALKIGSVGINPIIYAEIAPAFSSVAALERWLDPRIFQRLGLPYEAGWIASRAFLQYRKSAGLKTAPLPDFYIGAHAEVSGLTLITRDATRYRTYFPSVSIVSP